MRPRVQRDLDYLEAFTMTKLRPIKPIKESEAVKQVINQSCVAGSL